MWNSNHVQLGERAKQGADYFHQDAVSVLEQVVDSSSGDASSEAVSFSKDAVEVEYDASLDKVTVS